MGLTALTISAARAAWYAASEPVRLRMARQRFDDGKPENWDTRNWCKGGGPLVSVIIPTHNRVELLMERALPSVLKQTYTNLQIIVAAHGCTDGTLQRVVDAYISDLGERLNWIDVPRARTYPPTAENHWLAGPVVPLNAGLAAARGGWIARIDDDDEWAPEHIETLLRFAQGRCDYEFVSSTYLRRDTGRIIKYDARDPDPPIGGCQTWLYRSYLKFMRYNPGCWRKSWNRVNDTDLSDRFRKAGVRIGWLDVVGAYVFPRPGEITCGRGAYMRDPEATEKRFAFR